MMRIRLPLVAVAFCTVSRYAASITITDLSNSALTNGSCASVDTTQVQITGAAANALVQLKYAQNGTPGTWSAGYTNSSGDWTYSDEQGGSKIGTWTEQWNVGGVNVGPMFNFSIVDKPSSLTVLSVVEANPDCGSPLQEANPYGSYAGVQYQIKGQSGGSFKPLSLNAEPWEDDTTYNQNGTINQMTSGSVGGGVRASWTPPDTTYASSTGTYWDMPIGLCGPFTVLAWYWGLQVISIKIGNEKYTVRTSNWTSMVTGILHENTTNGDVNYMH
jgi:hypothetical protein